MSGGSSILGDQLPISAFNRLQRARSDAGAAADPPAALLIAAD
jgi:hypothetical protein